MNAVATRRWKYLSVLAMGAAALATLALIFAPSAQAAPGDLDPAFSQDGIVKGPMLVGRGTPQETGMYQASAVAIQPDRRIVIAGHANTDPSRSAAGLPNGGFALARYQPNGALDQSFGSGGYQTIEFPPMDLGGGTVVPRVGHVSDVAILPDGKILVGGTTGSNDYETVFDMTVARLDANGQLDPTFGDGGIKIVKAFSGYGASAEAMAIANHGSIFLGGYAADPTGRRGDFGFVKLTPTGQLDRSFSGDGKMRIDFHNQDDLLLDLVIDGRGRAIACGRAGITNRRTRAGIVRLTSSGKLDHSFSADGKKTISPMLAADAIAVRPHGQLLVSGGNFDSDQAVLAQLKPNGSLDRSFGRRGVTRTGVRDTVYLSRLALEGHGKAVLLGDATKKNGGWDLVLLRYTRQGKLDRSFSQNGKTFTDFGGDDYADLAPPGGLALQADGRIVVTGSTVKKRPATPPSSRFAFYYDLARYKG